MCNVIANVDALRNSPHVTGKSLSQLFPQNMIKNLSFDSLQPGCCLICKRHTSHHEMFPQGRTARAICPQCYANFTKDITEECPVCSEYLDSAQLNAQRHNPIEISNRIHSGRCMDAFSIASNYVLGQDMSFIKDFNHQANYYRGDHTDNAYNAPKTFNNMRLIANSQPALPPPTQKIYAPNIPKTYKGRKVVYVPRKGG